MQESKYGHVRTYGRGLERLLVRTYGQGLCTWGGNGMRRVHREETERVGASRLGRNSRWK